MVRATFFIGKNTAFIPETDTGTATKRQNRKNPSAEPSIFFIFYFYFILLSLASGFHLLGFIESANQRKCSQHNFLFFIYLLNGRRIEWLSYVLHYTRINSTRVHGLIVYLFFFFLFFLLLPSFLSFPHHHHHSPPPPKTTFSPFHFL